jgi:hypothetical protein
MLSQLVISIWFPLENDWSLYSIINLVLVGLTWITTFAIFVPLHQKIDNPMALEKSIYILKLVRYNWLRTFLWTVIFILTFYDINL